MTLSLATSVALSDSLTVSPEPAVQPIEEIEPVVPSWAREHQEAAPQKNVAPPAATHRQQTPRQQAPAGPVGIPYRPEYWTLPDTVVPTAAADTVQTTKEVLVLTMEHAPGRDGEVRQAQSVLGSWPVLVVVVVFLLVCARFKHNYKFFRNFLSNLTDTGERRSMFNGTVRETSFMVLLNLLAVVSTGLGLFALISFCGHMPPGAALTGAAWGCFLATLAYALIMPLLYRLCGYVFTEKRRAIAWTKAYLSSQALVGVLLLIPALLSLFYPEWMLWLLAVMGVLVAITKLVFISTGLRIFITRFTNLLVFLYYLCSLEIVPLILVYVGAVKLCEIFA